MSISALSLCCNVLYVLIVEERNGFWVHSSVITK